MTRRVQVVSNEALTGSFMDTINVVSSFDTHQFSNTLPHPPHLPDLHPPIPNPLRAMVTIASGGWTVGQDALASPGACPICLNPFSAVSSMGEGGTPSGDGESCGSGGGLKGADGLATASLPCGHAFCRRWAKKVAAVCGVCVCVWLPFFFVDFYTYHTADRPATFAKPIPLVVT